MFRDAKANFIEACYELYEKKMYYLALKILNDEMAAEDSVHNAFVKLIEGIVIFSDPESDDCKKYIITVTKNAAIDIYRKKKKETPQIHHRRKDPSGSYHHCCGRPCCGHNNDPELHVLQLGLSR